jgi:DNA-binding HxlR family transcriptional regulator
MPVAKEYQHFCPVARSLEVIGEKWSLLVVRDLLRGPQRFSDLQRYLGGITPKWLTQRLRDLQAAGLVERDSEPGRREVWYRLTPKGRDLAPVIESLVVWGVQHAMRPPREGEPVFGESVLRVMTISMNKRGIVPKMPVTWRFLFDDRPQLVTHDGTRWLARDDDGTTPSDLEIRVTARGWVEVLAASGEQRAQRLREVDLCGSRKHVGEFHRVFSVPLSQRVGSNG